MMGRNCGTDIANSLRSPLELQGFLLDNGRFQGHGGLCDPARWILIRVRVAFT